MLLILVVYYKYLDNQLSEYSTQIISVLLDMSGCINNVYCRSILIILLDVGLTDKCVYLLQSLSIDKLWPTHLHIERIK